MQPVAPQLRIPTFCIGVPVKVLTTRLPTQLMAVDDMPRILTPTILLLDLDAVPGMAVG